MDSYFQIPSIIGTPKGACKYYISTLGVGGGCEGNAYFAYVVRGGGGSRGKMLILLMYRIKIPIHLKNGF